jgi:RNA polymerase sigma-70 factor (ECF subfamily)
VVERLLQATARQCFDLAFQRMWWELSDMARRLDEQPSAKALWAESVPASASSDTGLSPNGHRILAAIECLPEGEREVFDLVRIQGMSHAEAFQLLEVWVMTVNRGLQLLAATLGDLHPGGEDPAAP